MTTRAAAYRRWTEGEERGLYFALPTQLTSNRIHNRVSEFLGHVIADHSDARGRRVEGIGVVPDQVSPLRIADLRAGHLARGVFSMV